MSWYNYDPESLVSLMVICYNMMHFRCCFSEAVCWWYTFNAIDNCIDKKYPQLTFIVAWQITFAPIVPHLVSYLVQTKEWGKYNLSSLKAFSSGSAPIHSDTLLALSHKVRDELPWMISSILIGLWSFHQISWFCDFLVLNAISKLMGWCIKPGIYVICYSVFFWQQSYFSDVLLRQGCIYIAC